MSKVTLGGDRLGAGKQQKVDLHNFSRSSHDLSYLWRSTMSSGTIVPFMSEVALPGDSFDIDLECDIKTHPTIGPLFGSYKVQLDVFTCPIRLYNGKLHMNMLNIGLDMAQIKLPQLLMTADDDKISDNSQINASSLFSHLNIRGLGYDSGIGVSRAFNAVPYLAYWDIYKNYFANKVEENGAYIHNDKEPYTNKVDFNGFILDSNYTGVSNVLDENVSMSAFIFNPVNATALILFNNNNEPDPNTITIYFNNFQAFGRALPLNEFFTNIQWNEDTKTLYCSNVTNADLKENCEFLYFTYTGASLRENSDIPRVEFFPLTNIDQMRINILTSTMSATPFEIDSSSLAPYGPPLGQGTLGYCKLGTQEGLALKTYQSDLFNNWVRTDWIDGANGINAITSVDTSAGYFNIDSLQLSKKVYDMLNRIAVSGGSYDDWLDAVYTHERTRSQENPVYQGGLIKELSFQEVISNAQATTPNFVQPLGSLAGRGKLTDKHKGGKINIKIDEPSYIISTISITPRIDYSQGNNWSVNLRTLDDLHKPNLDQIGFQDLITDQMTWWDTQSTGNYTQTFKSAGKQPAWINYMTNVNRVRGNFAEQEGVADNKGGQMYMTLNRRYERSGNTIKDLTTYIDPAKFNNIFADTRLDAQNFWAQIAVNMYARRKMSAKLMPNL